jgi:hypothetical protein
MKISSVEKTINNKFDSWVKSIKDPSVANLVKQNSLLSGGSICSLLLNEPVNDFDFYFTNKETAVAVAKYYVNQYTTSVKSEQIEVVVTEDRVRIHVQSAGVSAAVEHGAGYKYFEQHTDLHPELAENFVNELASSFSVKEKKSNTFHPIFISGNALTLSDGVQLVVRFFGTPEQIHSNYDFVHCTNYWLSSTRRVVTNNRALEAILGRELLYVGSKYPLASMFRTRKFIKRGWHITAGQMLKIAMQIQQTNLTDINTLQEQLVGVDVAYFHELIAKLQEHQTSLGLTGENAGSIDNTYLVKLIDEIF